jgi:hypothetical protein
LYRRGVTALCHYSPADNLNSIFKYGILSRQERRKLGVEPVTRHGWGTVDRGREFADFVCLGFAAHRTMMAREHGAVAVFSIFSAVVDLPGVCFAAHNTALNTVEVSTVLASGGAEALGLLFADDEGVRLCDGQCEVLVPGAVPRAFINGVTVHVPGGAIDWPRTLWWRLRLHFSRRML